MAERAPIVLVTGSSGYIGAAVCARLSSRCTVVGLDREAAPHVQAAAQIAIDLTSQESVRAALREVRARFGERIASVIHLAAYFDLTGRPHPLYETVTVEGTQRLLSELHAQFALEQFIYSSTMLVHRPCEPGERIDEDAPLEGKTPYPASKIETEKLLREGRGAVPLVIVRPAGVYDDQCHSVFLARQIGRIYERRLKSHLYPGALDRGQAALHLEDLLDALERIVDRRRDLPPESVFLLGESDVVPYGELQNEIGRLLHGEEWTTWTIPAALARTGAWLEDDVLDEQQFIKPWMVESASDHYALDTGRARRLLGWSPRHALRTSLPRIIESLRSDPRAWYRANKLNPARIALTALEDRAEASPGSEALQRQRETMRWAHRETLWAHGATVGLGLWLAASPFVFGVFGPQTYGELVHAVTAERGLAPPEVRSALLGYSSLLSGLAIMVCGALSFSPPRGWARWANTSVALWLLLAPLLFWVPSAAVYANDTLVAALVIALAVIVPGAPGVSDEARADRTTIPPGWTYSPSTFTQRLPIVVLGAIGFLISRQLAAYQLGHTAGVWDPFFDAPGERNGTEYIITSEVSRAWPVADAGLGAVAYLLEILLALLGTAKRWRTMPWLVTFFGVLVVPLGVVSIYFIIIQPIVIGTYCTLCLVAALAMLAMIPFAIDELAATAQSMLWSRRAGRPFWRGFFRGEAMPGGMEDRSDPLATVNAAVSDMVRGVTVPWTLVACAGLGVGLMSTPLVFGTAGTMAHSDHLVGALVVTVSIIALAEVARPLRFMNVVLGAWVLIAPWVLDGESRAAAVAALIAGVTLIALSLPRGRRSSEHYDGWDYYIV
jgi:nucleoside-diphosphate-sugar epimerase/uncharacterized membrane protein